MKRVLTLFVLLLTLTVGAWAVQPLYQLEYITQSDGSVVAVYRHGSRMTDFFTTPDGAVLVRNANKDLCYAVVGEKGLLPSNVLAHNELSRSVAEKAFLLQNRLTEEDATRIMRRQNPEEHHAPNHVIYSSTDDGLGEYGKSGVGAVNSIGDVTIPVIMVEFSDLKFKSTTTVEKMNRFFNEQGYNEEEGCKGSARDYFISQSNGMFRPTFKVVAKVTLSSGYATYGGNTNKSGTTQCVRDAVAAAVSKGVNFRDYAVNGAVPLVSILYAGGGEATGGGDDTLWPQEMDINTSMSGVHFNAYFVGNELYGSNNSDVLMGMGVFCHEFGHALGLPDFYVTNYGHRDVTMGKWSIMCQGCYLPSGSARAPIGYTAYERSYLGWEKIPELTEADNITLYKVGSTEGSNAALIRNDADDREYFILEQREPGTWYPESFGSGMFVQHVAYDKQSWYYNQLNNDADRLRCTYLSAVVTRTGGTAAELFPGSAGTKREITKMSNPSFMLLNGKDLDKPVYKITIQNDGSVNFNYLDADYVGHVVGDEATDGTLKYRFVTKSQVEVVAKDNGSYAGAVSIPAAYVEGSHQYTVVGIASGAFANCANLVSVSIPSTVKTIAADAFRNSLKVQQITVDAANTKYHSMNGVLYTNSEIIYSPETASQPIVANNDFDFASNAWRLDTSDSPLKAANGELTQDLISGPVTMTHTHGSTVVYMYKKGTNPAELRLPKDATISFEVPDNTRITKIAVTASLWNATSDAATLTGKIWEGQKQKVTLTATGSCRISNIVVTTSQKHDYNEPVLIYYPAALTGSFTVPAGVTRIGDYAFENAAVSQVVLSDSLQTLGVSSLGTAALRALTSKTVTPAATTGNPFTSVDQTTCTLTVPAGAEAAYKAANYWQGFYGVHSGIQGVEVGSKNATIYDLQGRRRSTLQKGVNIVNGKKVIF